MRLPVLAAHLGELLEEPASTFVELHRALREGIGGALILARKAPPHLKHPVAEGLLYRIDERLAGRTGPGGGIMIDPVVVAMLLVGSVLKCPRTEAPVKVLDVLAALAAPRDPRISAKSYVCPLTKKRVFGESLVAILTDAVIGKRVGSIDIPHNGSSIAIKYSTEGKGPQTSEFDIPETPLPLKPTFQVGVITFIAIHRLHEFIIGNQEFNLGRQAGSEAEGRRG